MARLRVLLIGGTGFIGSHVTDQCLACGIHVHCLSMKPEGFRDPLASVVYFEGDAGNRDVLRMAAKDCDVIVHLAHTGTPASSKPDLRENLTVNVFPFLNVLEIAQELSSRVVYVSSGGTVYGNAVSSPVTEDVPLKPISPYGVVKVVNELYLELFRFARSGRGVIIRPANAYGPRQRFQEEQGIIPIFLRKMLVGEQVVVVGDGQVSRDFVYVEDVARAIVNACIRPHVEGVFNIGSGIPRSINEILSLTWQAVNPAETGTLPKVVYKPGRKTDVSRIVLSTRAAKDLLDWEPKVELADGLRATVDWLRTQL